MRVGLIARAENRGLGTMTWEWYRHVRPDRTLVVDMGELARGFAMHLDRYPDATVVPFDGAQLPEAIVREWLDGLDVVYSAETFYDWHVCEWAEQAGVATVCHLMPEFFRHHNFDGPRPTAWWAPTSWRADVLPDGTRYVPVPVVVRAKAPELEDRPTRWLHVAGHRAAMDRNGTTTVLQAVRLLRRPTSVTVSCQDGRLPMSRPSPYVTLDVRLDAPDDYWRLYDGFDLLVMPRRYGGLCLPVQEAMGSGLGVVMSDVPPNRDWPIVSVPARLGGRLQTPAGLLRLYDTPAPKLAAVMDQLADPAARHEAQTAAAAWAADHSWDTLRPTIMRELARLC